MAVLDKEAADQSGMRWFGELDGPDMIALHYGNPNGSGGLLPNGQTTAHLSVDAIRELLTPSPAAVEGEPPNPFEQNPPGLSPTP
jgi:hypothetical protein